MRSLDPLYKGIRLKPFEAIQKGGADFFLEQARGQYNGSRLECCSNVVGRFLLCSVRDVERKKFCLVFPEGNDLVGGWFLLAKNLRALGVSSTKVRNSYQCVSSMGKEESNANTSENESGSYAEVVKGKKGVSVDSMRVHLGEKEIMYREEQLGRCLVGCFGGSPESIPSLPSLKRWAYEVWLLKGELRISRLGGALVLFEFQNKWEADMVLLRASSRFKDREFLLQRWGPAVGCTWKESHAKEVWVRVVGLPLHLWSREVFKRIGDCCGGFVAVDEETTLFSQLQWARILVKDSGMKWPGSMQVEAGNSRWELCLWWEATPRVLQAGSCSWMQTRSEWEVRDEVGGASCAESGTDDPAVGCSGNGPGPKASRGALLKGVGGPLTKEDAGWAEGPSSLCPKLSGWTKGREEPIGLLKPEAHLVLLREPVPSRASPETVETLAELEQDPLVVGSVGGMEPSLGHLKPTDDALLNEASRYPRNFKLPIFSVGFGASSPFPPFLGSDGVVLGKVGIISGLVGAVEEARSRDSPREEWLVDLSVHEDRNCLRERRVVEVGDGEEEWSSSCLAKFSHCLGMPTVGFEEEILYLLRRMRGRIEKKNQDRENNKTKSSVSKSSRELKKLEWTETKIKDMSTGIVRSLGVGRHIDWRAINSKGAAGGVLVFWDNRVVDLLEVEEGMFSVSCLFKNCMDGMRWVFTGVYGPVCRRDREVFWEELGSIKGLWRDPWCVGGDFNMIRYLEERNRGGELSASMRRFTEVVEDLELRDYPVQGGPLLGEGGGGLKRGLSPFRFENMWLEERGFMDQMKRWWGSLTFIGSFSFVLDAKLRALKGLLKTWNKEVFGVIETKKREALSQVVYWDAVENHSTLSLEDCEARKEAKEAYKTWVLREEISWRQRSRELWLKEGDNNTKFFHRMANAHSRRNWGWRPGVEGLPFMRLDSCEAEGLEIPFTEGEVFAALSDLGKDKAPARMASPWPSVPKRGGAEDLKDFRPISLVGSLYKLLAKVLANRIKKVLGKVISESQNAFVEGRQILDAVLIANEAVDSRLKDNVGGVLCKLDIEKAYDHVSWSFLLAILKEMGFGERWIKWIDWCISTVKFSVMMRRAISGGYLSGWKVSGGRGEGMHISHLLFADDTLVFCEESSDEMTYLSWLLMWFEACSGLRINLEKSEMIPVGRVLNIEGLALELGCKVGGIPSSYLGMPLGQLSTLWRKVRLRLEKIQRDFLWGGGTLAINLTLFANERDSLWRSVISLKYGVEEGGWCTRDVMGRNGVGLWKAIRKKWGLFDGRVAFHLGNGQRVKFWKDKWCGDGPLCESFPSLFSMSMSKNAWVSEVWNPVDDGIGWTPLFARVFNDWEIDLVERLLQKIQAFRVQREEEDRVIWTASNNGVFSVRSLYSMMEPGGLSLFLVKEFGGQECLPSEDNPSWVEWRVCGKKTQEGLANDVFMTMPRKGNYQADYYDKDYDYEDYDYDLDVEENESDAYPNPGYITISTPLIPIPWKSLSAISSTSRYFQVTPNGAVLYCSGMMFDVEDDKECKYLLSFMVHIQGGGEVSSLGCGTNIFNPFHLNKSGIYFAAIGEAVETNQETVRHGIWRCSICTFDNDESMSACDICGVLRYPLVNIRNNNDTKTADGICKDSGASIMAKSLFAQLPHRTLKKAVIFQLQNDDVVIEESSNFQKHGNIQGQFHEVHKAFSFHGLHHINIAPFKFDVPSPDELVSNGMHAPNWLQR
ncbi:Transposon TX1 uncharacterized 149 kDa protein [Vitis vinifera]|uniref:Transposon TX1 uncharacterized 149 kDa protein n=1 Tax=Vitis vinifera TaxID=29760 RepID=A0A438IQE6_VITVI|nr:Transposon TX1 uncharacterized 149 kDa protein [Vitis vinifera]